MSLPISGQPSTELEGLQEQPPNVKPAIKPLLSHHMTPLHRAFIAAVTLSQLLILVLFLKDTPLLVRLSQSSTESPSAQPFLELQADALADECESRRIYVYDLPPTFNYDLKNSICNQSNHCTKFLNDGFGPAAKELAGIVPKSILPAWYWTDAYWGDVLYHRRVLNYKCRTLDPESATAVYMPFYAGFAVGPENRPRLDMFMEFVKEQKSWKRSNGSDHFIMLGRASWDFRQQREDNVGPGSSFLNVPEIGQNVVHLTLDRFVYDDIEMDVPYPTMFHPRSESDIAEWQSFVRSRHRNHLFTFLGGDRASIDNSFRGVLQKQCLDEPTACRPVDCYGHHCGVNGTTAMMAAFLDSDFCLQEGEFFSQHSVLECMLAGSIPVFFSIDRLTTYMQYELFMPYDSESYSVSILCDDVRNGTGIKKVLEGYGQEKVERLRAKIVEYMPKLLYAKPSQGLKKTQDAFDIAIEGVLSKYKAHMDRGRIGN